MSTDRQIQASRINGSKSRGPVTPAGQLNSSRNAFTHGMLSDTIVLKGESQDRFLQLLADLHEEFQPQTPFEESLIHDMAAARWRRMRIWAMEKAVMEHEMQVRAEMSGSSGLDSSNDPATRAALAFRSLGDNSRSLDLINRYDSRYQRDYLRAHRRFLEVRDCRTPPVPQPAPLNPPLSVIPLVDPENVFLPNEPTPAGPQEIDLTKRTPEVIANTGSGQEHVLDPKCGRNEETGVSLFLNDWLQQSKEVVPDSEHRR